jgi:hypothetical protein
MFYIKHDHVNAIQIVNYNIVLHLHISLNPQVQHGSFGRGTGDDSQNSTYKFALAVRSTMSGYHNANSAILFSNIIERTN